jgi:spermidine synthase
VILRLLGDYAPSARCAMVLGLGAGVIPRLLAQQGVGVTVVEINPASIRAATDFFHFDPKQVNLRVEDARTAVRRFPQTFEVVVADLFQGDGTPEYLLSREFFLELQRSLQPEGLLVMNLFYDPLQEEVNQRLLATVASVFPCILELRTPAEGREVQNLYLVLANRPLDPLLARRSADAGHPGLSSEDILTLKSIRHIERGSLIHFTPVTDEHNLFPLIWAGTYVRFRRQCINLPPALLVN